VLGVLPGVIGTIQATETIKLITGIGETLVGRLLLFDALRMEFRQLRLPKNPRCVVCGENPAITTLIDYDQFCNPAQGEEVSPQQLSGMQEPFVVDVREANEWEAGHIEGARHIPLGELSRRLRELPGDSDIVIYCQSGGRSSRALEIVRQAGFARARHLTGGYAAWSRQH
jgi:adenylyltransferase/sulfurtransferase